MKKLLLALLLFAVPGFGSGNTYYVRTGGDNAHSCAMAQTDNDANAKRTIGNAQACLVTNDTEIIHTGTYTTGDFNPPSGGGSWATANIIKPATGETVTIQPASGTFVFGFVAKSYIKLECGGTMILDAVNVSNDGVKIYDDGAGNYSHHIRIANCEVKNTKNNGILAVGGTAGVGGGSNEIVGNTIHDCATQDNMPYGHAIYITSANNLIEGNTIHDCNSDTAHNTLGVHIYNSGAGGLNANIVRNNIIYSMTRGGCILVADGSNIQVYNNVCSGDYSGITAFSGSDTPLIYENTSYNNTLSGVEIKGTAGALVKNNILRSNGTDLLVTSGSYTATTNFTADPSFTNAAARDFTLTSGSAAIDFGTTLGAPYNVDLTGASRPQGPGYDAGAYEKAAATPAGASYNIFIPSRLR